MKLQIEITPTSTPADWYEYFKEVALDANTRSRENIEKLIIESMNKKPPPADIQQRLHEYTQRQQKLSNRGFVLSIIIALCVGAGITYYVYVTPIMSVKMLSVTWLVVVIFILVMVLEKRLHDELRSTILSWLYENKKVAQ